ncbi:MAG: DUF2905 domain-containing protein [Burkholderiaceae bacterium]|nr:DUF2905 domain-containing protein [Burkholderiaceae bacterium]
MRWLLVFVIASLLVGGLQGWLRRIGLGRLPGDITLRWRGREIYLPFASGLLFSFVAMGVGMLF